ncbi:MAG: glycosyltransferase family 4 protein [Polyangiaceae bacterium]
MRVLAITKIFPNSLEPLSSPFNRQQFKALAKHVDLTVLEAIPYVPGASRTGVPARAAKLAKLPDREVIEGIETVYMRQLYVPKVGLAVGIPLYLASLLPYRALAKSADVVLATWAYPDGAASVLFAEGLGKPCVVKVHGSDVNVIAKKRTVRPLLARTLPRAAGLVAVSRPLGEELAAIGVPRDRIHLVKNGVDTALFRPRDKKGARRELRVPEDRPLVVFCGRLEPQKGVVDLLAAFERVRSRVPGAMLALVGTGVLEADVAAKKAVLGDALHAPGARPLAEVATWMAAADVFTLPSWAEGTPNVVLEALASGRPAVGSDVGGIPDVLSDPRSGLVVPARDPAALAEALVAALGRTWDPEVVRATGPRSWTESGAELAAVLERVARP